MPRRKRQKSQKKQQAIRRNVGIAAWRRAAAEYLRKGKFVHLPKKGTKEHTEMKLRQKELMPVLQAEINELVKKEQAESKRRKLAQRRRRKRKIEQMRQEAAEKEAAGEKKKAEEVDSDEEMIALEVGSSDTDGERAIPVDSDGNEMQESSSEEEPSKPTEEDSDSSSSSSWSSSAESENDEWI